MKVKRKLKVLFYSSALYTQDSRKVLTKWELLQEVEMFLSYRCLWPIQTLKNSGDSPEERNMQILLLGLSPLTIVGQH